MANSPASEQIKAQLYKEALDTVEVINILDEDFIIHNDKMRPTHTKWIIPAKNKDLGHGKGKQHVPAFVGWRYLELALVQIITDMSYIDWNMPRPDPSDPEGKRMLPAKVDRYKDEEKSKYEEKLALKTDSPKLRAELIPKLWGGIVSRYGGDDILEPEVDAPRPSTRTDMKSYLEQLGLNNKLVEQASDEDLIKDIS
jgi:hypothetical protein